MAEVYRLQLAKKRGPASWGDVEIHESRTAFENALFAAMLEAEVANSRRWYEDRKLYLWLKYRGKEAGDTVVTRVIAAQVLVDGEWVDLKPRLIPPRLEFEGDV